MNVSLTPELERLIEDKVKSGLYNTASEVVREGLRLLKERDEFSRQRLEMLKSDIGLGLVQLDQGLAIPGDAVFDELRKQSRKKRGS